MSKYSKKRVFLSWLMATWWLAGCAAQPLGRTMQATQIQNVPAIKAEEYAWLNRITWGGSTSSAADLASIGLPHYLNAQLHPKQHDVLPAEIQSQINAMTITQKPFESLVKEMEQRHKSLGLLTNEEEKKLAKQAFEQEMNRLVREASSRSLLRAVYSKNQLQEQMVWFWFNHFNVFQHKHNIRAMVGDYEEHAIRPFALGRFRDLLSAVVYHPAMLRYLDNERNGMNHLNENYARELMELHTLGVDAGYSQRDVQELARILTGVGINLGDENPRVKPVLQAQYVKRVFFEFNPNRHDYGDKQFLGQTIYGRGLSEVDEVIMRLSRHPATAHFISQKLAKYFISNHPSSALVDRMAQRFLSTDGNIAETLATLFSSKEFTQSLGHQFKDPIHFVVSAVRLAYDEKPILNSNPMIGWLHKMGEPLYSHQTPDGYSLDAAAWESSGQMTTRFDIARGLGQSGAGLFKTEGPSPVERPAFPQLANALYYQSIQKTLGESTQRVLEKASSPQEWNTLLLSSPEFMYR